MALGPPPPAIDPVAPGRDLMVAGEGRARFGPLVCFEITDAASVRGLARRGARFVVNVNNDVWFGADGSPHEVYAPVRAVESGLAVARASNGGMSAIIDPLGRSLAQGRSDGRPLVVSGTIPEPISTLYVRTGEVFLPLCALVVLGGLAPRRKSKRRATADRPGGHVDPRT
jgi:apolipoprotein N-acyltransferase